MRVRAAAMNRADLLQRRGLYPPPPGFREDIPGLELAGEVAELGAGRDRLEGGRPGHGHRRRRGAGRAGGGPRADAAARARGDVARGGRRHPGGRDDRPRRPLHHRRAAPGRGRAHPRHRLRRGHRRAPDRPGRRRPHHRHQPHRRQAGEGPGPRPRPRPPGREGGAALRRRGEAAHRPARRRGDPRLRGRRPTRPRTWPAWRRAGASWSSAPWPAPRPPSTSASSCGPAAPSPARCSARGRSRRRSPPPRPSPATSSRSWRPARSSRWSTRCSRPPGPARRTSGWSGTTRFGKIVLAF